jgi:uncharacterized protein (TIGR03435 family)
MIRAFDLVVGKSGPKFALAQADAKRAHEIDEFRDLWQLNGIPITMEELAKFLSFPGQAGHPVVDKTGLAGRYILSGKYQYCQNPYRAGSLILADGTPVQPESGCTTIFDDMQVLGLELKGTKIPVDVLVIDQIEQPTEN